MACPNPQQQINTRNKRHRPLIPACGRQRQRQGNLTEFKASIVYIRTSHCYIVRPCLNKNKTKTLNPSRFCHFIFCPISEDSSPSILQLSVIVSSSILSLVSFCQGLRTCPVCTLSASPVRSRHLAATLEIQPPPWLK